MSSTEGQETSIEELPSVDMSLQTITRRDRSRFGNLIVLFAKGDHLFTLGPHYYLFLPTMVFFIAASLFLVFLVDRLFVSVVFKTINACFAIIQCGAYLRVALANPGILLPDEPYLEEYSNMREQIVCDKCGARHRSKRVRHCSYCDICVKGYDHHCPWVSKCIGAGNYQYFSFFIGISAITIGVTPLFIMYYIVVLLICFNLSMVGSKP